LNFTIAEEIKTAADAAIAAVNALQIKAIPIS
jgi:hypothetical protein